MSSIRESLLRQASFDLEELEHLSHDEDDTSRREELETLIDHLTNGILSPIVLNAVATIRVRRQVA
jgi:hypothetical protein